MPQSWQYSVQTPSGSLVLTQSTQDEFYNGELSGSEFIATDGNLTRLETKPITTSSFIGHYGFGTTLDPSNKMYLYPIDLSGDPIFNQVVIIPDLNTNSITSIWMGANSATPYTANVEILTGPYLDLLGYGDTLTFSAFSIVTGKQLD